MLVLAVVTTFFPNISVIQNIEIIKKQADLTLIIDNGSDQNSLKFLQKFENDPKIKIILNGQNLGIAKSCNMAASFLLEHNQKVRDNQDKIQNGNPKNLITNPLKEILEINLNQELENNLVGLDDSQSAKNYIDWQNLTFDWLLAFDQDSTPTSDYVSKMLKLANQIEKNADCQNKIGVICPTYFYESTGKTEKKNPTNSDFWELSGSMSSGSLIPKAVFEKGIFCEEKLFVDYFDLEFHLKLRKNGLKVLEASKIQLTHELGKISCVTFFGKSFIPTNYPAFRRYYQARNRILIYTRYFLFDPKTCLWDIKNSLADIAKLILAENQKTEKLKAVILGTFDGIINKYVNPVKLK